VGVWQISGDCLSLICQSVVKVVWFAGEWFAGGGEWFKTIGGGNVTITAQTLEIGDSQYFMDADGCVQSACITRADGTIERLTGASAGQHYDETLAALRLYGG
jgi:hypothetical protein